MKKAMVLAAGLGTRLRPLTNHLPKPLVPVGKEALLVHHIRQLANIGVQDIMINTHHLPTHIERQLGSGESWGVRLHYSVEEPDILGTGGGLAQVADFFKDEKAFFFINGDILHNIDLLEAYRAHSQSGAKATLLTRTHPNDGKTGWVGEDENQKIVRVPDMPEEEHSNSIRRMFTGLHVLTPRILQDLPQTGFGCILRTGYRAMIERGDLVHSHDVKDAFWMDIGTPDSYLEANWATLEQTHQAHSYIDETASVAGDVRMGTRVIIGKHAVVEEGCSLEECVIWPHAHVGANTQIKRSVVFGKEIFQVS